jgi:hypothetical protein
MRRPGTVDLPTIPKNSSTIKYCTDVPSGTAGAKLDKVVTNESFLQLATTLMIPQLSVFRRVILHSLPSFSSPRPNSRFQWTRES